MNKGMVALAGGALIVAASAFGDSPVFMPLGGFMIGYGCATAFRKAENPQTGPGPAG